MSRAFKKYCSVILLVAIVAVFGITQHSFAQQMSSDNYSIQSDSINFGGARSDSASYAMEDTLGEIATGESASASYKLKAGYQQMHEVYIAISAVSDVVMSPSIGGVSGGTSNGSTNVTVTTDSQSGYELMIKASSSPALVSGSNSFADYTPAGAAPDYNFLINASDSEFGFTPEGADIVDRYLDNGATCNQPSGSDTANQCWDPLSTSNVVISQSTSGNHPSGTLTTLKFRAQSGSSHIQPAGEYVGTTTVTAVSL
jgi:hypothetical protein